MTATARRGAKYGEKSRHASPVDLSFPHGRSPVRPTGYHHGLLHVFCRVCTPPDKFVHPDKTQRHRIFRSNPNAPTKPAKLSHCTLFKGFKARLVDTLTYGITTDGMHVFVKYLLYMDQRTLARAIALVLPSRKLAGIVVIQAPFLVQKLLERAHSLNFHPTINQFVQFGNTFLVGA